VSVPKRFPFSSSFPFRKSAFPFFLSVSVPTRVPFSFSVPFPFPSYSRSGEGGPLGGDSPLGTPERRFMLHVIVPNQRSMKSNAMHSISKLICPIRNNNHSQ